MRPKVITVIVILAFALCVSTPARAQEDFEAALAELREQLEIMMNWARELGESLGREVEEEVEEDFEPLERTLRLQFDFPHGNGPLSILCATRYFELSTRHEGAHDERSPEGAQESSNQVGEFLIAGEISPREGSDQFLIEFQGEFDFSVSHGEEGGDERGETSHENGHANFNGSALFALGEEKVLVQQGPIAVTLLATEE